MFKPVLYITTLLFLPAVCGAQSSAPATDSIFKSSDYTIDRDFNAPQEAGAARADDGKSVKRYKSDAAGILEAVKVILNAAPKQFKDVRIETSKKADEIFGGTNYDGRVAIDAGLLINFPTVELEDGKYIYQLPVLRTADKELTVRRVQELLKALPPLLGQNTTVGEPSEFAGFIHYDMTAGDDRPALQIEQVGSYLTIRVYQFGSQLSRQ